MITVYAKEGCPKCRVLKLKLNQHGLEFTEFNDMDAMIEMGIKSVPQMKVDDKMYTFEEAIKYLRER